MIPCFLKQTVVLELEPTRMTNDGFIMFHLDHT